MENADLRVALSALLNAARLVRPIVGAACAAVDLPAALREQRLRAYGTLCAAITDAARCLDDTEVPRGPQA